MLTSTLPDPQALRRDGDAPSAAHARQVTDHAIALAGWFGQSRLAIEHHPHDATLTEVAIAFAVAR